MVIVKAVINRRIGQNDSRIPETFHRLVTHYIFYIGRFPKIMSGIRKIVFTPVFVYKRSLKKSGSVGLDRTSVNLRHILF